MNLVAKEYVAAQDPEDPGVLILSRFVGAAAEFGDALLVNPYDTEAVGAAICRALEMPLAERIERHRKLYQALLDNDIRHWGDRFLTALAGYDMTGSNQRDHAALGANGEAAPAKSSARSVSARRAAFGNGIGSGLASLAFSSAAR